MEDMVYRVALLLGYSGIPHLRLVGLPAALLLQLSDNVPGKAADSSSAWVLAALMQNANGIACPDFSQPQLSVCCSS